MTFLELCRDWALECSIDDTGVVPTTVIDQRGDLLRGVTWIKNAWTELQNSKATWRWMRSRFSVVTSSGDHSYAGTDCTDSITEVTVTRFSHWLVDDPRNPPKCYLTATGVSVEYYLQYLDWESFRALYRIRTTPTGQPVHITVDPQNNIVLGPTPDDEYTATGEYQRSAQTLALDADEPDMPAQFHKLIVYDAMGKYAGAQSAQEIFTRVEKEGGPLRSQLILNQLPMFGTSRPLA